MRNGAAPVIGVLLLLLSPTTAAADEWVEVKSENFTVISDGGESVANRIASDFENLRAALQVLWPLAQNTEAHWRHLSIIAPKNQASFETFTQAGREPYRPLGSWTISGRDRSYIVIRADVWPQGVGWNVSRAVSFYPSQEVYPYYAGLLLEAQFRGALPRWLTTGLQAVTGTMVVDD